MGQHLELSIYMPEHFVLNIYMTGTYVLLSLDINKTKKQYQEERGSPGQAQLFFFEKMKRIIGNPLNPKNTQRE